MIADLKPYAGHKKSGLPWRGRVPGRRGEEDATKIDYEVCFTRHFYKPQPLCALEEISADILAIEKEAEGLLDVLPTGVTR